MTLRCICLLWRNDITNCINHKQQAHGLATFIYHQNLTGFVSKIVKTLRVLTNL